MSVDRSQLPVTGPPRSVSFPTIEKSALSNGLRVWTVRHPRIPVVAFALTAGLALLRRRRN